MYSLYISRRTLIFGRIFFLFLSLIKELDISGFPIFVITYRYHQLTAVRRFVFTVASIFFGEALSWSNTLSAKKSCTTSIAPTSWLFWWFYVYVRSFGKTSKLSAGYQHRLSPLNFQTGTRSIDYFKFFQTSLSFSSFLFFSFLFDRKKERFAIYRRSSLMRVTTIGWEKNFRNQLTCIFDSGDGYLLATGDLPCGFIFAVRSF